MRRRVGPGLLAVAAVLALLATAGGAAPEARAAPGSPDAAPVVYDRFVAAAAFNVGTHQGTVARAERLELADGVTRGTWVSPPVRPGIAFTQLVASWAAATPGASWIQVEIQPQAADGHESRWYSLGTWAEGDDTVARASVPGQSDADARVNTDTLLARAAPFAGYSLRATLERRSADEPTPSVSVLGAVVSRGGATYAGEPSLPLSLEPVELPVPAYSQEIHVGHFPELGSGGAAWCSPTSTAMVVAYWGLGPTPDDLRWVPADDPDPAVEAAARGTYDAAFHGTGNWPFNTAYAARFGLDAFVTQLRSLAEAERFVRAGIPVVASLKPGVFGLDGYLFPGSPEGHLLVIVGFDAAGNPIVNDPAAWSDAAVRRVYDRGQFERAWLGGSGGTAYVIHPPDVPLPPPAPAVTRNW